MSECRADDEFEDVEGDVGDDAVDPDGPAPFPSDPFDSREIPLCIYCDDRRQLKSHIIDQYHLFQQKRVN